MGEFPRKSDGRRVFTVEFKRGVVQQLLKGEKTLAEVSRELHLQPSMVRQWKRHFEAGVTAAIATNEDVVPVSALGKSTAAEGLDWSRLFSDGGSRGSRSESVPRERGGRVEFEVATDHPPSAN